MKLYSGVDGVDGVEGVVQGWCRKYVKDKKTFEDGCNMV